MGEIEVFFFFQIRENIRVSGIRTFKIKKNKGENQEEQASGPCKIVSLYSPMAYAKGNSITQKVAGWWLIGQIWPTNVFYFACMVSNKFATTL